MFHVLKKTYCKGFMAVLKYSGKINSELSQNPNF